MRMHGVSQSRGNTAASDCKRREGAQQSLEDISMFVRDRPV